MNEAATAGRSRRQATGSMLGITLAITALAYPSQLLAQAGAPKEPAKELATIPPDKDTDLKFYQADGGILQGAGALAHMTSDANLVVWVAGNQFFAMDEVIGAFQKAYPGVTIGLITLPPGLTLSAIQRGGWIYNAKEYRCAPDIYASVNKGHLRQLKAAGLMRSYEIYMHNELQVMVTKGNPKAIAGIDDLVRSDVRTSLPNSVNEGIMQFYVRGARNLAEDCERSGMRVLPDHGAQLVHRRASPGNPGKDSRRQIRRRHRVEDRGDGSSASRRSDRGRRTTGLRQLA
jgi:ABC-type molybdate transport system substrate-binding protein